MSHARNLIALLIGATLLAGCQRVLAPEVKVSIADVDKLRANLRYPSASGGGATAASDSGATPAASGAAAWGNLSGTFKVAGAVPVPAKLAITANPEFCGKFGLVDESVLVSSGGGLANVVVYIRPKGSQKVPIHPDLAQAEAKIELDNRGCRFEPHVIAVRTQQPLIIANPDPMGHNSKLNPSSNPAFNPVLASGDKVQYVFAKPESSPVSIECNIHSWMKGWIVARDDPYIGITDKDGKFEIKNLPAGDWEFQVWHEKTQVKGNSIDAVEIAGKPEKWPKGRFTRKIAAGDNSLGEIVISADTFK